MDKILVSPSRLKLWLDCKFAYYCRYILKMQDAGSDRTRLGSAIHELFEMISTPKKQKSRKKYVIYSIRTEELHPTVVKVLNKLLIKHKVGEITGKEGKEVNLHELGHKLVLDTFMRGYNVDIKVIDVEKDFEIPVHENVSIKGFIDKVCEISPDTLELVDYKSGSPFNPEQCEKEFQPFFYIIAAKKLYPQYKNFIFSFHFLKNKKIITVPISQEKLDTFLKFVIAQGVEILKFSKERAIPSRSFKCSWCAFKNPNPSIGFKGCPEHFKQ